MAIFTGAEGLFEITALSFTPNVIAFGETVSVSVTIKNISGKSVSKMYIIAMGSYASPDSATWGSCKTGSIYLYGGDYFNMAAVSWANGASKIFTFSYTFDKGFYDVDLSSYLLSTKLSISIVTGTEFSTGGNYDNFYDVTPGYLNILSSRDNPRLSMTLERSSDGERNDEGVNLLTDLKLVCDVATSVITAHGYTASISCTPALTGGCVLTTDVLSMLTGITDSTTAISGTFSNGTDYSITVTVSNGFETASATQEIARAFANVHMSGKDTGGICFGGFSSSEEDNPKLECYYPAFFYCGIRGVSNYSTDSEDAVGMWIDGRTIYRRTFDIGTKSVASGSITTSLCQLPGMTELVALNGRCYFSNTWFSLPRIWTASNGTLSLDYNAGYIRLRTIMSAATTIEKITVTADYLKDGSGMPLVVAPSAYSASSTYSSSYPISDAFNGSSSSAWASSSSDSAPYITVTLPMVFKEISISLYSRSSSLGGAPSMVKCCLGTSTTAFDESTAVTITTDGAATSSKLLGTLNMANTTGYRYFRLYFTRGSKQSYIAIGYITIKGAVA